MSDRKRDLIGMADQLRQAAQRLEAAAADGGELGDNVAVTADMLEAQAATLRGPEFASVEPPVDDT